MKEYRCPKCNSKNLFVKKVRNNTGLYCGDCGAWIKWVGKNELRVFEYLNRQKHVDDANSKQDDNHGGYWWNSRSSRNGSYSRLSGNGLYHGSCGRHV
jgi:transcription initiation factor TFIIIB Brf1 subunit/transcription initiation factor TFIIB